MSFSLGGLSISNPLSVAPKAPTTTGSIYLPGITGFPQGGTTAPKPAATTPAPTPTTTNTDGYGSGNTPGSYATTAPAVVYPDKSNDISVQNAGLSSVGATEDKGVGSINDAWKTIDGQYGADLASAGTQYGNSKTDNEKDLQTNKQTALETGVSGRQSLFGTLSSLGALNGTGVRLANRAIQKGTNEDLTTAANTFGTNQQALDSGYNTYTTAEGRLRENAGHTRDNNIEQVHNDAAKSRQTFLRNIGDDYQQEGKTAEAKNFYDQAAALFPSIAATNVPAINLGYSGGTYAAPTLSQYVGKANNTTVQQTPGATSNNVFNIPGLVALNKKAGS